MPLYNESFDLIVSVSTFEFIDDKEAASKEIKRVLKKEGKFVVVTPSESWFLDLGFKILTNRSAQKDFGHMREQVLPVLSEHFIIEEIKIFPYIICHLLPVYKAYIFRSRSEK
jgi:ubiquinone/menaquinone biosynthesis C-methylase UbiE